MAQIKIGFSGAVTKEQMMEIGQKMHNNAVRAAIMIDGILQETNIKQSPYIFYYMPFVESAVALDILAVVTSPNPQEPQSMVVRRSHDMTIDQGGTVLIGPLEMIRTLLRVDDT